jgi:hypothetical protein
MPREDVRWSVMLASVAATKYVISAMIKGFETGKPKSMLCIGLDTAQILLGRRKYVVVDCHHGRTHTSAALKRT